MLAQSKLHASDLVWSEGMANWLPAAQVAALQANHPVSPPTALPVAPPVATSLPPAAYPEPAAHAYVAYPTPAHYGGQQIPYYPTGQSYNGFAIAGMVLSFFPALSLFGLIFSLIALSGMKRSGNFEGQGMAKAGLIISCVWMGLAILTGCLWFTIIAAAIGAAGAGH
jgi:hypothetical protein